MKRLLALLMVMALIVAACGNDDDDAAPDEAAATEAPEAPAAPEEMMLDELNVAYFLEWPTANQVAQAEQTYDDALGLKVNWIPFASGGDMAQAMEAGDIDISYSQGLTPFANFVTGGSDLVLVGVAVSYADADNCVAHPDFGVTAANAAETLAGESIYTPLGNVTHFKLLKMLEHLGVDTATVELIQSEGGPAAVAALDSGEVAMACAFGGAVNQMIANGGNLVMTGSEQEAIGIRVFDIISTTGTFADEHPDIITGFLQVTEDANVAYNDDREPFIDTIAGAADMDRAPTIALLDAFSFPEKDVQLSAAWLGGTVQQVMKEQMDFFVEQGEIESALASYDAFVDTSFLEAVEGRAKPDELNVAFFLEWPTANQVAQAEQTYDDALGLKVNWIPFASGGDMAQAMEAGDIDISYSQGLTPFANFVTGGSDLVLIGVAVSYADADNCVAHPDFGVTAANAAETLAGESIYTPLGNVTHFKLLKMLEHLGVDTATVELIQSEGGPAAVAALDSGEVAMACAFGGAVNQMIANGGNLVMTGSEQEAIGIRVFDIISTTGDFADTYPSLLTGFLQVTEDANRAYNDDREPFIDTIAGAADMDRAPTIALLDAFSFPEKDVQLSAAWLGGTVQQVMKDQMDFFVEQGEIASALPSYNSFVDTSFLEAVN
ncbi:ABC transporter substrate-binding protein [Candidatus Poriferisocius sp.]|uniref:taurine ABC transporter substrate-binding protein n=1 Tax=Candidatus Poriferisocius sp. TaxID=3101276 RepID=UPI003B01449C